MKLFLVFAILLSGFNAAWAANPSGLSLSTGIVFPSNNGAIVLNPGRLVHGRRSLEVLVEPSGGDTDVRASFVGNSKSMGYGFQMDYVNGDKIGYTGLGFGNPKFGVGATGAYNLDTESFSLGAGFVLGGQMGMSFAATAADILEGLSVITMGIAYRSQTYRLEADMIYDDSDGSWTADPAVALDFSGGKFSIMAGYRFQLSPSGGSSAWRAGAALWISQRIAFEYLYKDVLGDHTVGMILLF